MGLVRYLNEERRKQTFILVYMWLDTRYTVISKRNGTFVKLPFFWRKVYCSETAIIQNHRYVRISDPGAPEKVDTLKLRYFFKRVYRLINTNQKVNQHEYIVTSLDWKTEKTKFVFFVLENSAKGLVYRASNPWLTLLCNFLAISFQFWATTNYGKPLIRFTLTKKKKIKFCVFCSEYQAKGTSERR